MAGRNVHSGLDGPKSGLLAPEIYIDKQMVVLVVK